MNAASTDWRTAHSTVDLLAGGASTFDAELDNPVEMRRQEWQAIPDNFAKRVHAS